MRCGLCDMWVSDRSPRFDVFPCWETPEETSHPDNVRTHERTSCVSGQYIRSNPHSTNARPRTHSVTHTRVLRETDAGWSSVVYMGGCMPAGSRRSVRLFVRLRWC